MSLTHPHAYTHSSFLSLACSPSVFSPPHSVSLSLKSVGIHSYHDIFQASKSRYCQAAAVASTIAQHSASVMLDIPVILDAPSRCQALDQTPVRHPVRHPYSGHKHHLTQGHKHHLTQVGGTWWQGCGECSLRLVHELKLRCISYVSLLSLLCLAHMCLCERACAHMHQREWHTLALLQV